MQFVFPQQKQVASQIHKTLQVFVESQGEIRPHFHLTGPSGSGKTHLLKPHWKAEADEAIERFDLRIYGDFWPGFRAAA